MPQKCNTIYKLSNTNSEYKHFPNDNYSKSSLVLLKQCRLFHAAGPTARPSWHRLVAELLNKGCRHECQN